MTRADSQSPTNLMPGDPRFSRNVGWNMLGNLGGKVVGPAFQILIARLLLPEDFGAYAIALAWLAVFEVAKDCGLTQAIVIDRGGRAETDLQFTVQLLTATLFYASTLLLAPLAAGHFARPELSVVLPLVAAVAFIGAVADPIITGYLVTQRYSRLAMRQMVNPIASGVVGLALASMGYGVYALAIGLVAGHLTSAAYLWLGSHVRLRLRMDGSRARELMSVGRHVLAQRVFGFLVGQADSLIVGRALGPGALGFYRMGNVLAFMAPSASVFQAGQVVFTDLSSNKDPEHIRSRYNSFTLIAGPALLAYSVAVYLAAPWLVPTLLGTQWTEAVPLMQLFAAAAVPGFLTPLNLDLAKILGFAGTYSRYTAIRSVGTVAVLIWASQYSTLWAVTGWVGAGLVAGLVNDVIFYSKQDIVRPTPGKAAVLLFSWIWAGFVIISTAGWLTL